ncbi:MAG: DUF2093 domain-containing protein [Thermaurantiacus sp.]
MLNMTGGRLARVRYLSGSMKVLVPGDHVLCAVTGQRIALNDLRYWSHELQEAYLDAETAVKRHGEARAQGLIP